MIRFEWSPVKAAVNEGKHGVRFVEATTVFGQVLTAYVPDPAHLVGEARFLAVGFSSRGRVLLISYTERDEAVRIISAREATPRERRSYERRQR